MIKKWFTIATAVTLSVLVIVGFSWKTASPNYTKTVKVALRTVGHQLLLQSKDSTSWVMPIKDLGNHQFEIYFQKELALAPDRLVDIVQAALVQAQLPTSYIVEVRDCISKEVFYSFQMNTVPETSEIPCLGRNLPTGCYNVGVTFLQKPAFFEGNRSFALASLLLLVVGLVGSTFLKRPVESPTKVEESGDQLQLGSYWFDVSNRQLLIGTETIELSAKEFELLSILSETPNQVVERDRLLKEIWEDKGVFVGRSLDMFISKLRKKLAQDDQVKITNIRGVGYKLEVTPN